MSKAKQPVGNPSAGEGSERVPWPQVFFDDIFLLLTLGLTVPLILYVVWSLMDLASVPRP